MAYVQVPKDLTRVKTKVMFNLTKRQLICFSLAGLVGIPFYLLTRHALGSTLSACMMIVLVLPFFLFSMYEKDGMPLEKVLMNIIRMKFQRPGIRPYKTENFYAAIQKEIYEKEGRGFEQTESKNAGKKKAGNHKRKNRKKGRS